MFGDSALAYPKKFIQSQAVVPIAEDSFASSGIETAKSHNPFSHNPKNISLRIVR